MRRRSAAGAGRASARAGCARSGRHPARRRPPARPPLPWFGGRPERPPGTAIAASALVELLELVADEFLDAPLLQLGDGGALEPLEQLRVARDQAAVEQRRADGVVLARELDALV